MHVPCPEQLFWQETEGTQLKPDTVNPGRHLQDPPMHELLGGHFIPPQEGSDSEVEPVTGGIFIEQSVPVNPNLQVQAPVLEHKP